MENNQQQENQNTKQPLPKQTEISPIFQIIISQIVSHLAIFGEFYKCLVSRHKLL